MKNWIRDILKVLMTFSLGALFGNLITTREQSKIFVQQEPCIVDTNLNFNCVSDYLDKHRIKFSHIVLAQAQLESSIQHNSDLAKKSKNILGMKVPAQRYSFAINYHDYGNYAKFASIEDCIRDYKSWQIQNAFFITDEEQYFNLLTKIYASDKDYVTKLKRLIKRNDLLHQ